MIGRLKEIYAYREMIFSLVRRDLKGRYKGSVLGFLWTFLNPLFQLIVYTMVFSTIMRSGIEDYYLFLFVALIPWIFFSTSLGGGSSCVLAQQDMVKKIYFPREVLLGFTMIMSAVTVYIRDAEYIIGIVTMAWQFLTPVMYSMDQVPEDIRWVFILNPMTYIITAYRDILYLAQIPKLETLVSAVIIGITLLIVGWGIFCKLQKHFVEEL